MSKSENKNDNKSMFLYTALIFFVAVILIIVSFFGQNNMQKSQPQIENKTEETQSLSGISEKAAVLSEENRQLLEENSKLKEENASLTQSNEELMSSNTSLSEQISVNNLLLSANGYFTLGNDSKALEVLNTINYDGLTGDQKILYDSIKNNIQ